MFDTYEVCEHCRGVTSELSHIHQLLHHIIQELSKMATQADLDTALTTVEGLLSTASTDITTAIADLEAKIAASGATVDLQPEVDRLNAIAASLTTITSAVTAADPGAAPTS